MTVYEDRISDWSSDVCSSDLFRDDAFAVALRDSSVILDPFGLKTALTHARRCGADLVLRLKVDALRFVAAMIYAGVNIQFRKPRVDMIGPTRSEEHTSELQSLMRISYAVFCLKKKYYNK